MTDLGATRLHARQRLFELILAIRVRLGPLDVAVAEARRLAQQPGGIGQVRPGDRAQVRTARGDDPVDLIAVGDRADGHRRDAALVANAVGKRRLVHPAIHGLLVRRDFARRAMDHVGPCLAQALADGHRIVDRRSARRTITSRDTHRDRQVTRPHRADRFEHFQREAQAVLQ